MLGAEEIGRLIAPYLSEMPPQGKLERISEQLAVYLELLTKWNGRMNLTAVRDPVRMVERHFGESLFLAGRLRSTGTVLDLGSGAGFPGIPIQLWHPELRVTLAESQTKKAVFLREVVRTLGLTTEVWSGRAESLIGKRRFEAVVLRAVDDPKLALDLARELAIEEIWLLASSALGGKSSPDFTLVEEQVLPNQASSTLYRMVQ